MSQAQGRIEEAGARRRVLAATDLSSRADRALLRAAMIAQATGAELLALNVVDDDQPRRLVEAGRREAAVVLREQLAALHGAAPVALIEEGDPFETILRVAEARSVDLVVLGEHRRRLLRDIFSGTTAERVIRYGRHPVLMVNRAPAAPYRHAIAATDLSAHAARAIRVAHRLGLAESTRLTLLHAFEPAGLGALALADAPAATVAAREAAAANEASSALADFAATLGLPVQPERQVAMGRPGGVIKDAVARLRPDLLVIGTAGAGHLRRMVLGSVAAEVVGAVDCDVLAVPPEPGT